MPEMMDDRTQSPVLTIMEGKGKGRKVIPSYSWGKPGDPVPLRVRVLVKVAGRDFCIDSVEGPFESLEAADEMALNVATDWYEKGNG